MKSLKESILKSVKAGKYSINPKEIKTYDAALEYAKFLYSNKIKENSSEFIVNFNNDLCLIVLKIREFSVNCAFKDKFGNILWDFGHKMAEEIDWELVLRPEKWCKEKIKYCKNRLKKCDDDETYFYINACNKIKMMQKLI